MSPLIPSWPIRERRIPMTHVIHARLLPDGRVSIPPVDPSENPLIVLPNDEVKWNFFDAQGLIIPDAEIQFQGFLPESRSGTIAGPGTHPFTSTPIIKVGPTFQVANTDRGLYLYVIIHNNQELEWEVPLFTIGSFSPFFGGIIIRDP
jgi:hypothetical protein